MSLFEVNERDPMRCGKSLSRRSDPATSKAAARAVAGKLGQRMAETLATLQLFPGSTASELDATEFPNDGRHRKRLNDLRKRGLARKGEARTCRVTGRKAMTWHPGGEVGG